MAEQPPAQSGAERRKVLDESQASAEIFDEGVISDIEQRLATAPKPAAKQVTGEKVELDKADLPLLDSLLAPPEEEAAPVEVDLAGDITLEAPEPEPEAPPGRNKLYLAIAAGGLVVMLTGGGLLWWWLAAPKPTTPVIAQTGVFRDRIPDPTLMLRLDMEPFLVPLVKEDKPLLLKLAISLEVSDPSEREALTFHKIRVRDAIYRLLRDRPADELDSARGKNLLQAQIKTEVNHVLGQPVVQQVYFTNFVITG